MALFSISATLLIGWSRRRRWIRETAELEQAKGRDTEVHIRRVRREQRANDFLWHGIRRIYYLITFFSVVGLVALPFLSLEPSTRMVTGMALTATTFLGALFLLAYWRGSDHERESLLRRKLRQAEERAHARRGLAVRDEVTGAYTLDFWLHALELRTRRIITRRRPVTCVMVDVEGLPELRARRGSAAGDDALIRIGREIIRNTFSNDLVARYRGQRFVIALNNCPARVGKRVAERIAYNIEYLSLEGTNKRHGSNLHLRWSSASIPQDASTPIQLLRVTETSLDRMRSLIPAEGRPITTPEGQTA